MPLETAWTTGRTIWPCSATWRSTSWAGRKVRHPYEQNSKKPHGITIISSNSSPYFEMRLPCQLEELVRQKVASGLYTSASEVIREALRLLEEQDRMRAAKLGQLRRDIQD